MTYRNRVKELRRVRASELVVHPRNWRTHPPQQRDALAAALREVGLAGAVVARELPDGRLQLIDGHLRADLAAEDELPVLVVDVTAEEAEKLLATFDPLSALAETNEAALRTLLADVASQEQALQEFFHSLSEGHALPQMPPAPSADRRRSPPEVAYQPVYEVIVECADEVEQQAVFELLRAQGRRCRLANL